MSKAFGSDETIILTDLVDTNEPEDIYNTSAVNRLVKEGLIERYDPLYLEEGETDDYIPWLRLTVAGRIVARTLLPART